MALTTHNIVKEKTEKSFLMFIYRNNGLVGSQFMLLSPSFLVSQITLEINDTIESKTSASLMHGGTLHKQVKMIHKSFYICLNWQTNDLYAHTRAVFKIIDSSYILYAAYIL